MLCRWALRTQHPTAVGSLPLSLSSCVCSLGSAGRLSQLSLGAWGMRAQYSFRKTKCHLREMPHFYLFWRGVTEPFTRDLMELSALAKWKQKKSRVKLEPARETTRKGNKQRTATFPQGRWPLSGGWAHTEAASSLVIGPGELGIYRPGDCNSHQYGRGTGQLHQVLSEVFSLTVPYSHGR